MKKIPYRMFWNWDHSTGWCENVPGSQDYGVGNAYTKKGEFYEKDFRRVVDWCADHGMQAICVAGLVRDVHGGLDISLKDYRNPRLGIEATRRLCGYAREKGVRICIIGGLFAYGGAYYEGAYRYSLDRFLRANPDCMARTANGEPHVTEFYGAATKREPQGCPSSEKLRSFVVESYGQLFRDIPELGGIQMEAGDNGVCQCARCKERRGQRAAKDFKSLEDMATIYSRVCAAVRDASPDALVIAETYHHFLDKPCGIFYEKPLGDDAKALLSLPKDVFWQWQCDVQLDKDEWPDGAKLSDELAKFHNVMRSHAGTQWWGGRGAFAVEKIRRQCRLSSSSGFDAVSMFGEVSPFEANAEFNYLALQYFADTPDASLDAYAKDVMAPRLGGVDRAHDWIAWANLEVEPERIPDATAKIARIAADAADREARRRWMQLAGRLESFRWEWERNGRVLPVYCRHPQPMKKTQEQSGAMHL